MKRIISIFLLTSFLLSSIACSVGGSEDKTNKPSDTTSPISTTSPIEYEEDELPDSLDFGGETITFMSPTEKEGSQWDGEITVEELTSEPVNDSIYNREKAVEDRLGVEIENTLVEQSDYNKKVTTQLTAGEDSHQVFAATTVWFAPNVFDGNLYDFYDLNYIDLEKPWWSQHFNEEASFRDHLYLATGSLSLSLTRFLFCVYYNKALADDYKNDIEGLDSLYEIVESGDWTYDKFYEMGSGIYKDMNGNSERDEEDIYGISLINGIATDPIWSSFDIKIFNKDETDWYYLDINQDKLYSALDKVNQLLYNTTGAYVPADGSDWILQEISSKFAGGSILFMINKLHEVESSVLRNMQDEYGILPFPKYDDNQKDYYSYAHDQYLSFSIPNTNPNPDIAAAVLEAMASYSYRETEPTYLDLALKGKYMSDASSRNMIDLVVDGFKVDASWIYCQTLGNIGGTFRDLIRSGSTSYASTYASTEKNTNIILKITGRDIT